VISHASINGGNQLIIGPLHFVLHHSVDDLAVFIAIISMKC